MRLDDGWKVIVNGAESGKPVIDLQRIALPPREKCVLKIELPLTSKEHDMMLARFSNDGKGTITIASGSSSTSMPDVVRIQRDRADAAEDREAKLVARVLELEKHIALEALRKFPSIDDLPSFDDEPKPEPPRVPDQLLEVRDADGQVRDLLDPKDTCGGQTLSGPPCGGCGACLIAQTEHALRNNPDRFTMTWVVIPKPGDRVSLHWRKALGEYGAAFEPKDLDDEDRVLVERVDVSADNVANYQVTFANGQGVGLDAILRAYPPRTSPLQHYEGEVEILLNGVPLGKTDPWDTLG